MSGPHFTPDAVTIAVVLSDEEREALLSLPEDGSFATLPASEATVALLLNHAIPLIAVVGDWARRTRMGSDVCRRLQHMAEQKELAS